MSLLPVAVLTGVLLCACAPPAVAFNPQQLPAASDFGPRNAPLEWWYVSGYLPESELAFHWAQFKVNFRGVPFFTSHVAVTDLRNNTLTFTEQTSGPSEFSFPPLKVQQGEWKLQQDAESYTLNAGPLQLNLTPRKPAVLHPPGYSGTPETGQMYYQSVTRLDVTGVVNGREARGEAWFDHQWGDQLPSRSVTWDWFGLQLSNGADLMVYRVKNARGDVVQLAGSWVDAQGVAREVRNLRAVPLEAWRAPSGRSYVLSWELQAAEFHLRVDPVRREQELLSGTTFVAYWEGPVRAEGSWGAERVRAQGMAEFVAGPLF
ncbi:lipocalin family protein [Deinococcus peraridilitoris]|uniref:Putative secreted hydrolase n=1 Tax=Deinococcus peraridilitoris (strain DSM 19664 / LMG 22246 / CIP 109416 / KR-200) TaxID=937777 RepID=L0A6E3_DEIPD|nr:lipocalin family protein [Deinococcus peraridilitoris]AFZ69453.1 putative secreted hydrolase [Deinococcus peraridilitoris DSM 19664]